MTDNILGIKIDPLKKEEILEKILKVIKKKDKFLHVVSINPENLVISAENKEFKKAVVAAQIKIIDGVGVSLVGRLLNIKLPPRLAGVDLMVELINLASRHSLRVVLIGGKPKVAEQAVECQKTLYPGLQIMGMEGIEDIKHPTKHEEKQIFSIVSDFKPHLLFFAFGSPYQEIWIEKNKKRLGQSIAMGVGGGFDFMSGRVWRAPVFIRSLGLEWLFRLIIQPWRIIRQISLLKFIYLTCVRSGRWSL